MTETGQVVLVVGASSGFGAGIAAAFHAGGCRVYGTSRRAQTPDAFPYTMLQLDVTDPASVQAAVDALLSAEGRLDILVHCAGYGHTGLFEEMAAADFERLMDTNFNGAVRVVRAVLPVMRAQRAGRVIVIGSIAGTTSAPGWSAYCASKAALVGCLGTLRDELRPFGVWVTLLEPAYYRTNMQAVMGTTAASLSDYDRMRGSVAFFHRIGFRLGGNPAQVTRIVRRIAAKPRPPFRVRAGWLAQLVRFGVWILPGAVYHAIVRVLFRVRR